jgi:hypothetical protein
VEHTPLVAGALEWSGGEGSSYRRTRHQHIDLVARCGEELWSARSMRLITTRAGGPVGVLAPWLLAPLLGSCAGEPPLSI